MKELTKVRAKKYLTMFGIDAIEAQILSEYFQLNESPDTGNEGLDAFVTFMRIGGYFTVGIATTLTTNKVIDGLFVDAESMAAFRDKDYDKVKDIQKKKK